MTQKNNPFSEAIDFLQFGVIARRFGTFKKLYVVTVKNTGICNILPPNQNCTKRTHG